MYWANNSGFLFFQANKAFKRLDVDKKKEEIEKAKAKYNISSEDMKKWSEQMKDRIKFISENVRNGVCSSGDCLRL